ncbi:Glycoside hydrolase superfamily,Glycosyl hydrolase, family 13, catalytic domain [Cinara cedri]|uniref:Glycoside hydrolase superfamily,Glycosyl hydrolase, family 13, catalytic domain n=1 Tax=Cinara cedri TaxID=506608 RepID=A0A5E4MKZ9_9HEMI|nr:Glycoside hydrolase superfamily,Glycosyl hydrolase, family 13, catalytic domain [Cinara cedri]
MTSPFSSHRYYVKQFCMVLLLLNLVDYFAKADNAIAKNENNELDWWQTAIFYQIYPRSFRDSNGDGVGDLKGIEEKAEHFKDIGVDCIWLSPIFKSPMADFGYDISDYNQIDSIFGTIDDFVSLKNKLKSLGLKIILDFVPNHSSDEHEWFTKSVQRIDPYTDYYVWKDAKIDVNGTKLPPNNWRGPLCRRVLYLLSHFDVIIFLVVGIIFYNNLRFWLELGVDGYRVDAVPFLFEDSRFLDEPRKPERLASKEINTYLQYDHPYTMDLNETYDMISQFRSVLDEYKQKDGKTRVMIIESYTTLENTMRYYGNEKQIGVHLPFNFQLVTELNAQSNATKFSNTVNQWLDNMPKGKWPNWVIGNHDQPRVATRFGSEMVDGINMLNLLLPGTVFTYMGEEIGMEDANIRWSQTVDPMGLNAGPEYYKTQSRDPPRSPYQWDASVNAGFTDNPEVRTWLPVNPNYWRLNLAAQKNQRDHLSHYAVYKRLAGLRKTRTMQHGVYEGCVVSDWVFAFSRSLSGAETYLVVMNVGTEEERVDLSGLSTVNKQQTWIVHTPSINSQYSIGNILNSSGFTMRPKSALVLTNQNLQKNLSLSSSLAELSSSSAVSSALLYPSAMILVALGCILTSRYGIFGA